MLPRRHGRAVAFTGLLLGVAVAREGRAQTTRTPSPPTAIAEDVWSPFERQFPFQTACVSAPYPENNVAYKAVAIRLGPSAALSFDTDLLRVSAGWTGPFLTPTGVAINAEHGGHPEVAGDVRFGSRMTPGWADEAGRFDDPRPKGEPYGPVPEKLGRWDGLYVSGDTVTLAYSWLGAKILEQPSAMVRDGRTAFVRTFKIDKANRPLTLLVADVVGAEKGRQGEGRGRTTVPNGLTVRRGSRVTVVATNGLPPEAKLELVDEGRVVLRLPKNVPATPWNVVVWEGHASDAALAPDLVAVTPSWVDGLKGGRAHFPTPIVTKGAIGTTNGAYVLDRITTPFPGAYGSLKESPRDWRDNVYRRRMMIGGFDFFPDGKTAAVATWEGDVWIVSGIDDKLERVTWRRFASGLYETLGLKIVNGAIYTSGRDQITRLHDLDKDGEADFYENFNNQVYSTTGFHEFQFGLESDKDGNFYTTKAAPVRSGGRGFGGGGGNGEVTKFSGTLQRISKDGKRRDIIATGFRAPNGLGVGPNGELTTGDNEGTWQPACPIHWVKPGSFQGVEDIYEALKQPIPKWNPPLAWLPMSYDNSGGGQVWVTSKKWGPLEGELLHLSYGKSAIYRVLKQKVGDLMQGGVVRVLGGVDAAQYTGVPLTMTSSAMRGRFNPVDGQLYVAGLRGWQTNAANNTGFDRIRYTGKPVYTVTGLSVDAAGLHLTFSHPLDADSVDPKNFSGERWNYRRTKNYGSPDYKVSRPEEEGRDKLTFNDAELSSDGRTVTLDIADIKPVNQMLVRWKLKAKDGTPIIQSIAHTIHVVPPSKDRRVARAPKKETSPVEVRDPGLVTTYTATTGGETDTVVAPGVRLFVAGGRSPSALLPPGPFRAVWEGFLTAELGRAYRLQAELSGTLTVELNGKVVLDTTKGASSEPITLGQGANAFKATYTAPSQGDAFVRLGWLEPAIGFEPIPAAAFSHKPSPAIAESTLVHRGRALFLENRCVRCHAVKAAPGSPPELAMDAPSLAGVGDRLEYGWLRRWILSPRELRRGASMPRVLDAPTQWEDAAAVAAYLAAQKGKAGKPTLSATTPAAALKTHATEGHPEAEAGSATLFDKLRCTGCHAVPGWETPEETRMSIGALREKWTSEAAVAAFLRHPDALFAWTRMPDFRLDETEARELAGFLWAKSKQAPASEKASADAAVIAKGKELVETKGCLSCHDGLGKNRLSTVAAAELARRVEAAGEKPTGCLSGGGKNPRFGFSAEDQRALQAFLRKGLPGIERHDPIEFAARQTASLQCGGCHNQIPGIPAIEIMGDKLRPEWAAAFIAGQVPYKPRRERNAAGGLWMEARMPAFPKYAAALAEGLAASHGYAPRTPAEPPVNKDLAKIGSKLVSSTGGLACVTCHGAGGSPATQVFEVEGINLAHAGDRLMRPYFERWMRNPLRIDPSSKMPSFFDEEGKSALTDVLGGDARKQLEAIWNYMRLGAKMPKPGDG